MADLIDRKALIAKCGEWYVEEGPEIGFIGTLKALLDMAPAVDAAPVKYGRWLYHKVSRIGNTCIEHVQTEKCSVCKRYITTPFVYGRTVNNYCPHCGAKNVEVDK